MEATVEPGPKPVSEAPPAEPTQLRACALLSMPRLCFATSMRCSSRAFAQLQIPYVTTHGVYWDQALCRVMKLFAERGYDFLITLDYDSVFDARHVQELLRLMVKNPDVDVVFPVQTKQGAPDLLVMLEPDAPDIKLAPGGGDNLRLMDVTVFSPPLTQVGAGHFGLTVFRVSSLLKVAQPWMHGQPNGHGLWDEGRIDPDWSFWRKAKVAGLKVCQANWVRIGHLQMVVDWPGDDFNPVHQYVYDYDENGVPANILTPPWVNFPGQDLTSEMAGAL